MGASKNKVIFTCNGFIHPETGGTVRASDCRREELVPSSTAKLRKRCRACSNELTKIKNRLYQREHKYLRNSKVKNMTRRKNYAILGGD